MTACAEPTRPGSGPLVMLGADRFRCRYVKDTAMCRSLVVPVLAFSAAGCANSYTIARPTGQTAPAALSRDGSVYVSLPEDGRYGDTVYNGSGADAARSVAAAFSSQVARVEQAAQVGAPETGLSHAADNRFTYFVDTSILHWEDRATHWSGRPDQMTLKLVVFDAASRRVLDTVTISGRSKWATFGGDHPQDLLREPLATYAAELFGAPAAPPRAPTTRDD
jgi:hypothetical protein